MEIYLDKDARLSNKKPIEVKEYECEHDTTINSMNVFIQSYNYLKTLDE